MEEQTYQNDTLATACAEEIWNVMHLVWHSVRAQTHREVIDGLRLTMGQFHILRRISLGKKSVSELASSGKVSLPAISRQVDGLVNKGLVKRERDANDRRTLNLELTDLGKKMMDTLNEKTVEWISQKLKILSESELKAMITGLNHLSTAFMSTGESSLYR